MSPQAQRALDAGNAAYRAKRYTDAIALYREAAAGSPVHAAPWFGVYMAANELRSKPMADSAMQRVNALSADAPALASHAAR
jgi:hypothetical protein